MFDACGGVFASVDFLIINYKVFCSRHFHAVIHLWFSGISGTSWMICIVLES